MKKYFSFLLIFVCILSVCSSFSFTSLASNSSDPSASSFTKQMKVGWNLGNSLDSHYGSSTGDANLSQETIWGNPKVTKEQIDYVKSLGFDVIRVPVTWHTHTYRDENGTLHIYTDWLKRVSEVVDYCISDGLYVIINIHHDGEIIHAGVNDTAFAQIKVDARSLWSEIASYFSNYDTHLIFESYNEVDNYEKYWSFGENAAAQMNELNQLFVDVVRASGNNNASRILMVPTLLHSTGEKFQKSYILPNDLVDDRLIISVHNYSHQFDQSIDTLFASLNSFSNRIGAPVIIDEWGTRKNFTPSEFRAIHAANYIARSSAYGIKCIYWDNGSDYAIIDRKALTCNEAMVSSIMNPSQYEGSDPTQISDWADYMYMTVNQNTGALKEDKSWGTIIINKNGNGGYPLPMDKKTLYVGLSAKSNMSDQRIHYVYFFDSNNNLLDKINDWNGFTEKHISIPPGSSYVRIGINNANSATTANDYKKAIEDGELFTIINLY